MFIIGSRRPYANWSAAVINWISCNSKRQMCSNIMQSSGSYLSTHGPRNNIIPTMFLVIVGNVPRGTVGNVPGTCRSPADFSRKNFSPHLLNASCTHLELINDVWSYLLLSDKDPALKKWLTLSTKPILFIVSIVAFVSAQACTVKSDRAYTKINIKKKNKHSTKHDIMIDTYILVKIDKKHHY